MIPILLVSNDEKNISAYLDSFIADNKFSFNDIYKIYPLKEEISINQVRELKKDFILSQPKKKLVIFYDFHASSIEAQNALLKILEEDVERNQYILISKNSERVLTTIRSRTKTINLDRQEKIKPLEKKWLELLEQLKKTTSPGFLSLAQANTINKEEAIAFFHQATIYFREKLRQQPEQSKTIVKILKEIFKLSGLLESNNLNPQLSFDNLLIFIWKSYNMK